jgi:RNA polymerase sigma-B factor
MTRPSANLDADGELFCRWQKEHDEHARELLVERYLPLARKLAGRYKQSSVPREDLIQVASLGLVKAIDRYDPERGNFGAYAVPTILGEIRRHFRDNGWATHVPRGAQERALSVREGIRAITAKTGHDPTVTELAQYLELEAEEVIDGLQALRAYEAESLETPLVEEEGLTYSDTLGGEDPSYELVEDRVALGAATRQLDPQSREIIELRFGSDLTQQVIGERLGISQMQISRILRRVTAELRESVDDGEAAVRASAAEQSRQRALRGKPAAVGLSSADACR